MSYKGCYEDFQLKVFFIFLIFVRTNSHKVVVFCGWSLTLKFFIFFIFVRTNSHRVVVFCGWSLSFSSETVQELIIGFRRKISDFPTFSQAEKYNHSTVSMNLSRPYIFSGETLRKKTDRFYV